MDLYILALNSIIHFIIAYLFIIIDLLYAD